MPYRAPLRNHPHIAAIVNFILGLLIFGGLMPRLTHESPKWSSVLVLSVILVSIGYLVRIRSERIRSYILLGGSLLALGTYGFAVFSRGFPQDGSERGWFAFVIAIPVVGLMLGLRLLRRQRVTEQ